MKKLLLTLLLLCCLLLCACQAPVRRTIPSWWAFRR